MWITKGQKLIVLAPMADMTDQPFCRVCREVAGHDFVIFSEMVSSEALVRGNAKTLKMCEFTEFERPFVIQLFGASPETITSAAKIVADKFHPDGIDINMGCPVPKITGKNLAGAALMKDPVRAVEIVKKLKEANLGVPISVKTRLGWGKDNEILEFALKLENAGAEVITVHGRTKTQGYTGEANWERIAEVKKLLKIPVLANGDVKNAEDIQKCFEVTGADGVMIGRGALGNPWIFATHLSSSRRRGSSGDLDSRFFNRQSFNDGGRGNDNMPNLEELKKIVLRHAELHVEHYGEEYGLTTFRKHLLCYFKGERVRGFGELKNLKIQLTKVNILEDLQKILNNI